ncbi:hypothetical protein NIE88_00535 [Sporolactobacillus shoreicorticis]|uniref:Uncharacterized protein n=1 Tax=Sporolactobacillus shoreicorticis TaxID=1923877 RepID=A0ABW5S338_9BACL|nr:hypothetical protein [Sporolactobacillus shoreicorticis]MCO7124273.1 hypothetical protein [Sporolactobacillus shoreicorticis]
MLRDMYIVQFIDHYYSSWYLSKTMLINTDKTKYTKGDIIVFEDNKYLVLEDYAYLRVAKYNCKINPLVSLIEQIPNV